MAKTCAERFKKICDIVGKMAAMCGADCMKKNYKMNFLTWFVVAAINAYFICTIYTIYVAFAINDDWKLALETLSLSGSAVQGYSKLIGAIKHNAALVTVLERLNHIYKEYQKDTDFLAVLKYRINLTTKILKSVMHIYINGTMILISFPFIYGHIYGKKLFIMEFLLPGIDPETNAGYMIYNVVHFCLITLGCFGNLAGDMYIFIFIIHVPLLKDVIKIKCDKFKNVVRSVKDPKITMPILKDILQWHQSYNKYTEDVEESYYGVIFVQVFTSVLGISCTLFTIIIRSWPAAPVYFLYSLGMLYAYCGLGHLVEVSNSELIDIIYGDILWYELSVPEQKLVLVMLAKSQAPTTLTVGHIMPLSMSTALSLTKAIYSYMMMIMNFLETDDM